MGNCSKGEDRGAADDMDVGFRSGSVQTAGSMTSSIASYSDIDKEHKTIGIGLDDFQIKKVIGRGSFGKVYMVEKRDTKNIYAMKTLQKDMILRTNQLVNTKAERDIMQQLSHPFIVKLHFAFQTPEKLYFVTDFLNGGELFYHLCNEIRFKEPRACFYAAEIVLALNHLHSNGIIYRDLKPENVILDSEGHLKVTDFGLSKFGIEGKENQTYTFCGTPEYLAPEVILQKGHGQAVDWWSLGMMIYEMISGYNPFKNNKPRKEKLEEITGKDVDILAGFSKDAGDLLRGLLNRDPEHRFGFDEIKVHPFFATIDWEKLANR